MRGRVAPMIEIGVGFHNELTGHENIYLNASLYVIDVPVKNYSTGMHARLGFSIAVHLDPDILLIDEVFAVGDARFQKKCMERMMEFRHQDKTIVFVSHSSEIIKRLCDRVCLLSSGTIIEVGAVNKVLELYKTLEVMV